MTALFITQEYAPLFAEGGLGLTSAALPAALHRRHGLRHDLVLPYYPWLVRRHSLRTQEVCRLPERLVAGVRSAATVHRLLPGGDAADVYLVRADAWYERDGIYRDAAYGPFADEAERAAFFGWCVADWLAAGGPGYDLVHGNDWQSGAAMAHLRERFPRLPQLLTIHNAEYEGVLRADPADLGLPPRQVHRLVMAAPRRPNLLLAGALAADATLTCSQTYAAELLARPPADALGAALRASGLSGVIFGVDERLWDPAATGRATVPYDADSAEEGKRRNKLLLRQRLSLAGDADVPVIGVCSRLVPEKGTDLLIAALSPAVRAGRVRLVLVGPAAAPLDEELRRLGRSAAGYLAHVPQFDQDVAWLTYAGADLTVMPSLFEPGGLNQLIAYRYGTVPVVRPVGGLRDTVVDLRHDPEHGTGFHIPEHTSASVRQTVDAALEWLATGPAATVRRRVMRSSWSWDTAADRYAAVYRRLLPPGGGHRRGVQSSPDARASTPAWKRLVAPIESMTSEM